MLACWLKVPQKGISSLATDLSSLSEIFFSFSFYC